MTAHRLETKAARYEVEVWADTPREDAAAKVVTLYVSDRNETTYLELTPSEARALAVLLIVSSLREEKTS